MDPYANRIRVLELASDICGLPDKSDPTSQENLANFFTLAKEMSAFVDGKFEAVSYLNSKSSTKHIQKDLNVKARLFSEKEPEPSYVPQPIEWFLKKFEKKSLWLHQEKIFEAIKTHRQTFIACAPIMGITTALMMYALEEFCFPTEPRTIDKQKTIYFVSPLKENADEIRSQIFEMSAEFSRCSNVSNRLENIFNGNHFVMISNPDDLKGVKSENNIFIFDVKIDENFTRRFKEINDKLASSERVIFASRFDDKDDTYFSLFEKQKSSKNTACIALPFELHPHFKDTAKREDYLQQYEFDHRTAVYDLYGQNGFWSNK